LKLSVSTNIHDYKRTLKKMQKKQLPYAYKLALNSTAFDAMRAAKKHMRETFNKPIAAYLPAGIKVEQAKKDKDIDKMFARIDLEDWGDKGQARRSIMKPHIEGGTRRQKKAERLFLSPGRYLYPGRSASRDRFGNLHTSQIVKAISDVGRNTDATQNTKRKKKRYFAINTRKQKTIIMQRNGNSVTPFMVEGREPTYKKRFMFYQVIEKTIKSKWARNMDRGMRKAMKDPK
jgi:hypothetical protein|tara:strand:- start:100 stop:795 length:696 start_codon:yes stop_codon:yes gene_type:complete